MHDSQLAPSRPLDLPRSRAARLALLAPVAHVVGAMVPTNISLFTLLTGQGGDDWPPALTVVAFAALIGGGLIAVAGGVLAVGAVVRGERSLLLLVPIAAGLLAIAFALGEVLTPH